MIHFYKRLTMDPHGTGPPPSGSLTCMLCRGSIPFSRVETQNYRAHLQHHHGVFYHHDVLISVNLMSKNYLRRIVQECADNDEKSEFVGEEDTEEVVELEERTEKVPNISANLIPSKSDMKKDNKVHNCKTCNMKFERLSDLIDHVNEHKAEEKRKQEEIDIKRQEIETERRRVLEEKKMAKHHKLVEKRRLEEEKTKPQMLLNNARQTELIEDSKNFRKHPYVSKDYPSQVRDTIEEENRSRDNATANIRDPFRGIDDSDMHMPDSPDIAYKKDHRPHPVVFQCQECPYTSKRNIELKLHTLKHSGEKKFVCELCDEKFFLDRHLRKHLEQKHVSASGLSISNNSMNSSGVTRIPAVDNTDENEDTPSMPKKKLKKLKTELNIEDETSSTLSWNSNSEDSRLKPKSSLGPPAGRGVGDVVENSEYFRKYPNQIRKGSASDERFILQEPSMPEGWKVREIIRPSGRVEKEFLSPDFMVFRSRISMVEYLKYMGQNTQEEIERAERDLLKKKC